MKIVVIGGGAAGMMLSTQYKKQNPNDQVIVYEKSKYVAWAGCPTPYYIANELPVSSVVSNQPEDFISRGIDLKIQHEVISIDIKNRKVKVKNISNDAETYESYDKLILAVGAKSFIPNIEYLDKVNQKNVFTLSHATDALEIYSYLETNNVQNAVIVGSGFVGIEMAEALRKRNVNVCVIEKSSEIFPSFSKKLKSDIYKEIEKHGIKLMLNNEIVKLKTEKVENNTLVNKIFLNNGEELNVDMLMLCIGVIPNIEFIRDTEIEMRNNKIVVNDHFETSVENIYAIGDCVLNKYYNTDYDQYAPFGDVANKHGMILSKIISGQNITWKGLIRSFASSIYNVKFAQTGLSLEEALTRGYDAEVIEMKALYKIASFKEAKPNKMEIVYDKKSNLLLGASIVGYEAVAQFIDQIAIVITCNIPIDKFIEIDFAYSPTNASVWNPLLVIYRKVMK